MSMAARLLFIGLWNFADDEGRMVRSAKKIKMQVFPSDALDVDELLEEIECKTLIETYEVGGERYLHIKNFGVHQKIDKRNASKLPSPPNHSESPRLSPNPPDGREGKGREGIKEGKGNDAPPIEPERARAFDERDYRKFCTARTELLKTERSEMGTRLVHEWVNGLTEEEINRFAAQQAGIAPWRLVELLDRIEPKAKAATTQ